MSKVENFDGPVLIEYKKKGFKRVAGVVVAIGPGIIGWSLCKSPDVFHKEKGLEMAMGRAKRASGFASLSRELYYSDIPFSLRKLAYKMLDRSYKYYKSSDNLPF